MVISFSFLEYRAIFTHLSFFTVRTAGLTKQFSSMLFAFSMWPCFISLFNSFSTDYVSGSVLVFLFVELISRRLIVVFLLPVPNGVVFMKEFFEISFQRSNIPVFHDMVYLGTSFTGVQHYSQLSHPVQS